MEILLVKATKEKTKTGSHKSKRQGRSNHRKSSQRGVHRDPQALLKRRADERLELSEFFDGDLSKVATGLVVSRKGPVYIVRWQNGFTQALSFGLKVKKHYKWVKIYHVLLVTRVRLQ